ncbi:MAG: hypothetical protein AAFY57_10730 [Cyanobacteria bacterium J06642_2]
MAQQVGLELSNTTVSLDSAYDSRKNRKAIFNRGMIPNIPENRRGRKTPKQGRKRLFKAAIYQERFLPSRESLPGKTNFGAYCCASSGSVGLHYALKSLAYTMINVRRFCKS